MTAPDPRHPFVFDSAHIISNYEALALNDSSRLFHRATGIQVVYITLPSLGRSTPEELAFNIRRKWRIGQGTIKNDDMSKNRAIVFLVVPDRSSSNGGLLRMDVGLGAALNVSDTIQGKTVDAIKPLMAEKQYGAGLIAGFRVMAPSARLDVVTRQAAIVFPPPRPIDFMSTPWPKYIAGGIVAAGLLAWLGSYLLGLKHKRDSQKHRKHRSRSIPHQGMLLPSRRLPAADDILRSQGRSPLEGQSGRPEPGTSRESGGVDSVSRADVTPIDKKRNTR